MAPLGSVAWRYLFGTHRKRLLPRFENLGRSHQPVRQVVASSIAGLNLALALRALNAPRLAPTPRPPDSLDEAGMMVTGKEGRA